MSGQAWEPTPLPLEHAELVLGLERLVYGESDVAERPFYEWLYRANPAGEGIIWYAATGSPEAPSAGHYAVVPMRVAVHGETVRGSLSLNTLTHPRYRRQGVFAELAERVFAECDRRGIAFTYGFPNPASFPGFVGRLRFAGIGRVPLLLAPLRPRDITPPGAGSAWRLILRAGAHLASALSALARRRAAPAPVPVTETSPQLAIWDRLWERLRGKYPVMVVRDRAYVAWRFGACPTRRYRLYLAERDGEPLGFAATRVGTVLGLRAGLVVDLVTAPGARGHAAGRSLVRAAVAEFAASEVPLAASLALRHTAEYACLRSAGFFRCPRALEPQPFPVILRRHGAAPVPATIGEWLLTMGDYDAV